MSDDQGSQPEQEPQPAEDEPAPCTKCVNGWIVRQRSSGPDIPIRCSCGRADL